MASSLKEVIRSGEGPQVEFKKTISSFEKIAKTLVAFANSRGGLLLIGIQDDKQVIGVADIEEEYYMLEQAANFYCNPVVPIQVLEEEVFGKMVLVVRVEESGVKPHQALNAQGEYLTYIRTNDQCMVASPLVIKSLNLEKEGRDALKSVELTNNQKALYGFLDRKRRITIKDYAKLINVSKGRAYKILTTLTLDGQLYIHTLERTIFYTRA